MMNVGMKNDFQSMQSQLIVRYALYSNRDHVQMQVEIAVKAGLVLVAVGVVRSLLGVRHSPS